MSKHGRSWSSSDEEEAHPSWWGKQRKMEDCGYSAVDDTNDEEDNDLQPWWDEPTNSLPYLPTFRDDEDDYSNEADTVTTRTPFNGYDTILTASLSNLSNLLRIRPRTS